MKTPLTAALRLAAFAAVTFAAVSIAWFAAKSRIAVQEQGAKIAQYREINPDIDPALLDHPENIEIEGNPAQRYTAADGSTYYQTSTYKGYNGEIKLLIGIAPGLHGQAARAQQRGARQPIQPTLCGHDVCAEKGEIRCRCCHRSKRRKTATVIAKSCAARARCM